MDLDSNLSGSTYFLPFFIHGLLDIFSQIIRRNSPYVYKNIDTTENYVSSEKTYDSTHNLV
jgi:hypothetical protein